MFWPMMAIIGRQPTLQRKCFTCVMCMCCLVRVKTLVFKIYIVKSNRIFLSITVLVWSPVMVMFLYNRSSALCWSRVGVPLHTPQGGPHTGPTQYRWPIVKEDYHHWDLQQDSNQPKKLFVVDRTYFKYWCFNPYFLWSVGCLPMMAIIGQNM
jgi:hypothetical protein